MEWFKQLFSEQGSVSWTRVAGTVCILTACVIGFVGLVVNKDLSALAILCGTFLGSAFGAKVIQKKSENE